MEKIIIRLLVVGLFFSSAIILALSADKAPESTPMAAVIDQDINTVIVDPGHGGVDGGAVGVNGEIEKDINLSISLKLKELLEKNGYKVIMTRDTDISIHDESANTIRKQKNSDLHNRLDIINQNENALFVSVHQNTINDSSVHGAQIFYSPNNACSKVLAQAVQDSFRDNLQPENNKSVKEAGKNLFLLYNAKSPAILAECGFISNPTEAKNLSNEEYQQQVAEVIFKGIENYFGR